MRATRKFLVIGIGTGNPEHVTMQAVSALNRADIVLLPRKGAQKDDLAALRRDICRRYLTNPTTRLIEFDLPVRDEAEPSYLRRVADWHGEIAALYARIVRTETGEGASVALLVWGDPSLYDSTLRILDRLESQAPFTFEREIVPGITSIQALCAAHGIALNTVGGAVHVTTGRRLRRGECGQADTILVLLDGDMAFRTLDPDGWHIHWGAYLGAADEIVIAGPLAQVGEAIAQLRAEARADKGWIMDTYLLRRL